MIESLAFWQQALPTDTKSSFDPFVDRLYTEVSGVPIAAPGPDLFQSTSSPSPSSPSPWQELFANLPRVQPGAPLDQVPGSTWLPNFDEIIPTLHIGQAAKEDDSTSYPRNSAAAQIYEQNKAAIVLVQTLAKDQSGHTEGGAGSGFFIDNHGDLATAYHVVKDSDDIIVTTADGVDHLAKIVSARPTVDLAIVSIGSDNLTTAVQLESDSDSLKSGDLLTAIGHPDGWARQYLSPGKFKGIETFADTVCVDREAKNPQGLMLRADLLTLAGSSGCPVFDRRGKVVGIVALGDSTGHSCLVSVNDVWPMVKHLNPPTYTAQKTLPHLSDFPSVAHFGLSTFRLSAASAAALSLLEPRSIRAGGISSITAGGICTIGTIDLVTQDLPFLKSALHCGSTREKISAYTNLGGDVMMIGGAVLTYIPQLRSTGVAISMAGSLAKLGNDLAAYRRYD